MATLKIDMCSACSFVIPTMQPAMTAADLFAQWMSSASHNTQASAPFLSTFSSNSTTTLSSRTHLTTINATTVYHSSFHTAFCSNSTTTTTTTTTSGTHRPTANTSTICQLRLHNLHLVTLSTHHITAQPCQVFSHHHTTTQPYPILSSHHHKYGSFLNYQPTPHSTSTTLVHQFHSNFQPLQLQLHHWVTTSTTVHDLAPHAKKHRYQQVFQFYNHNLSKHTTAWVHLHILAEQSQRSFDMQRHIRSSSTHSNHLWKPWMWIIMPCWVITWVR